MLKSSNGTKGAYPVMANADRVYFILDGTLGFSLWTFISGFYAGFTHALLSTSVAATGFSYTRLEVDIVWLMLGKSSYCII